jgi:predicted MPP superfamily phosphohydrolase
MDGNLPKRGHPITRRVFLGAGAAGLGFALYAGEIARHELVVRQNTFHVRDLPTPFLGMRIAQISDIHFDDFTEPFFLRHVVKKVNALNADMVLVTGDFISRGFEIVPPKPATEHCAQILSELTAPTKYGILGNHDQETVPDYITQAVTEAGVIILRNRAIPLERGGERLWLAGADDPGTGHMNLDLTLPKNPGAPVLLMVHEPDFVDDVLHHPRSNTVSMMLSGHTHGGQVRLPFVGALVLPPFGRRFVDGSFKVGNIQLYVNTGIGAVGLPFRLNCPPEITVHTLQSA